MASEAGGLEVDKQDLIFRSSLVLQRPILDPCLAVGFLPLASSSLRVGQLVTINWRIERLKGYGKDELSADNVSMHEKLKYVAADAYIYSFYLLSHFSPLDFLLWSFAMANAISW